MAENASEDTPRTLEAARVSISLEPAVANGEVGACCEATGTDATVQLTPLWAVKCVYFIATGSSACLWKFMTVFYHKLGMSNSQIGFIQFLSPNVSFVAQLFWASVCDRLGSFKEVLAVSNALAICTICCLLLPFVQLRIWLLCIVVLAASFFAASRGSINDSMSLQVVKNYKEAAEAALRRGEPPLRRLPSYGEQRLWGAGGWGAASLLGGMLMDVFGTSFMFASYAVLLSITVGIIVFQYPSRGAKRAAGSAVSFTSVLSNCDVVWFLVNLFVYGLCSSLVETFLFVFLLQDFNGTSQFLLGSTIAVMCAFEIPVFFYVERLFAHVDLTRLISVCHFVLALRCLAYSVLPRQCPALVLVIEPLHGITFAMMWCSSVEYGKRLALPGAEAKMQALLNGLYYQLAQGWGSFFWGRMTEAPPEGIGFTVAYQSVAVFLIIWSLVWNFGLVLLKRRRLAREVRLLEEPH